MAALASLQTLYIITTFDYFLRGNISLKGTAKEEQACNLLLT
jgi:hypothetical protein